MPDKAHRHTAAADHAPDAISLGVTDGPQPGDKLELVFRRSEADGAEIELRLLAWGEGIGWYPVRTIPLPQRLAELRVLLSRAERVAARGHAQANTTGTVLPFPTPAGA